MSRLLHRIWLGPDPMPAEYVQYGHKWAALNQGWTLVDHGPEVLTGLLNDSVIQHIRTHGSRPDPGCRHLPAAVVQAMQLAAVASYEVVFRHGGLYVDCDVEPLRPLAALADLPEPPDWDRAAHLVYVDHQSVSAGTFASPPQHPFMLDVIDALARRYFRGLERAASSGETTGPDLITARYHAWLDRMDPLPYASPVKTIGYEYLSPVHYCEVDGEGVPQDAFNRARAARAVAVHHWAHRQRIPA